MYYLTFDQDWAPAWATIDILETLSRYGLVGTLFVTNECSSLQAARSQRVVELGLHPNFLPGSSHGSTFDEVLDHVHSIAPEAQGVRAHGLMRGTPLLQNYKQRGFKYDASDLLDGEPNLRPFSSWTGMWRLPIWWEDDVAMHRGFDPKAELPTVHTGLRVINVHPVLHALNASTLDGYDALKSRLRSHGRPLTDATREDIKPFREDVGVATWFDRICGWLASNPEYQGGTLMQAVRRAEGTLPP